MSLMRHFQLIENGNMAGTHLKSEGSLLSIWSHTLNPPPLYSPWSSLSPMFHPHLSDKSCLPCINIFDGSTSKIICCCCWRYTQFPGKGSWYLCPNALQCLFGLLYHYTFHKGLHTPERRHTREFLSILNNARSRCCTSIGVSTLLNPPRVFQN